jgi:hypothetical protein
MVGIRRRIQVRQRRARPYNDSTAAAELWALYDGRSTLWLAGVEDPDATRGILPWDLASMADRADRAMDQER